MNIQHRVIGGDDKKGESGPRLKKLVTHPYFKQLYGFKPGHFDALYIIDYMETQKGNPEDPKQAKKKSGKKLTVAYRYCSNTLDLSQDTFEKAMALKNYRRGECWFNAIWDFYGTTLLRQDKQRNKVTRETILRVIGQTEESIKQGLTIGEILPFFKVFKLKLRVFNIFYKLVFKYDPPAENI